MKIHVTAHKGMAKITFVVGNDKATVLLSAENALHLATMLNDIAVHLTEKAARLEEELTP